MTKNSVRWILFSIMIRLTCAFLSHSTPRRPTAYPTVFNSRMSSFSAVRGNSENFKKDKRRADTKKAPAKTTKQLDLPYSNVAILEEGKARLFKDGNPIIYNGAVKEIRGNLQSGDDIFVVDHNGNLVGRGFFNSHSQYKVRLIARSFEDDVSLSLSEIIERRLDHVISVRKSLFLPSENTTAYRLVNGEGDSLSGLMIDVFNDIVTIQSSAVWVEKNEDLIRSAVAMKLGVSGDRILWKRADTRLKQDGFTADPGTTPNPADSTVEESIVVKENGCLFSISPQNDQKTGFYCDQRMNRLMIRNLAKGKTVLDTYSYTGGFSFNALMGGATSVTAVDSAGKALEALRYNLQLNIDQGVLPADAPSKLHTIEGDCPTVLGQLVEQQKTFDMVICDPPKLAPRRTQLDKALSKYTQVNALAMKAIHSSGGLLLSCSCSAAMTQSGEFVKMLQNAAKLAKRRLTILSETGAAPDHTVVAGYPEGKYLTAVLAHIQ